ncbi:uncharacterized protein LOC132271871 [Cornus florida]|uniref:uncharacterized protein LOC132271871 n=1 Tax=Cornus florida TaxID=4283 RepID=UPI00289E97BB|nr:uncharacterized protein LOC132271871 [Cornus florida]
MLIRFTNPSEMTKMSPKHKLNPIGRVYWCNELLGGKLEMSALMILKFKEQQPRNEPVRVGYVPQRRAVMGGCWQTPNWGGFVPTLVMMDDVIVRRHGMARTGGYDHEWTINVSGKLTGRIVFTGKHGNVFTGEHGVHSGEIGLAMMDNSSKRSGSVVIMGR